VVSFGIVQLCKELLRNILSREAGKGKHSYIGEKKAAFNEAAWDNYGYLFIWVMELVLVWQLYL